MEKTFIRVRSVKDIVIFSTLIIIGILLVVIPSGTPLNITGFFLVFAGIILLLVLKTAYKDTETGQKYQKKEHYFQQAMHSAIFDAMEKKPESIDLAEADKGNAIKLDIYYSKATGLAYMQLFEYVPYRYEPCSKVYEHQIDKVKNLL